MRNDVLAGLSALIAVAACSPDAAPDRNDTGSAAPELTENQATTDPGQDASSAKPSGAALPPVRPPAPGTPGGLPDDRTPVSEAPFGETSAQGAANVVQTYFGLIESGRFGEAWRLWSDGGKASGMSEVAFAASFARYAEYHAQIGAPGRMEGAAGSLYVEVPVVVYGRLKNGGEVHMSGPFTLRRANDVPGSTAEQRRWHIHASGLERRPR